MTPDDRDMIGALAALGVVTFAIANLILPVINVFVCLLLQGCYRRIPPQFRKMQPGMVWLLMIPCFSVIWNFFVFPGLSKSLKAYFSSINRTDVGDCQEGTGIAYSICYATFGALIIPLLGCLICFLTGIAGLILLILYLIKTNDLKNQIPAV